MAGSARTALTRLGLSGVAAGNDELDAGEGSSQHFDLAHGTDSVIEPGLHRCTDALEHEDVDRGHMGTDLGERVALATLLVRREHADGGEPRAGVDVTRGRLRIAQRVETDLAVDGDDVVAVTSRALTGPPHRRGRVGELAVEEAPHAVPRLDVDGLGRHEGRPAAVEELPDDRDRSHLVSTDDIAECVTEALDRSHIVGVEGEEDPRVCTLHLFVGKSFVLGHGPSFYSSHRRITGDKGGVTWRNILFKNEIKKGINYLMPLVAIEATPSPLLCAFSLRHATLHHHLFHHLLVVPFLKRLRDLWRSFRVDRAQQRFRPKQDKKHSRSSLFVLRVLWQECGRTRDLLLLIQN